MSEIGIFRQATSKDITEGNIVFLIGDGNCLYRMTVQEVLRPSDPFKAFCAEDGGRYGLDGLWVLKSSAELHSRIEELEGVVNQIREAVA